MEHLDGLKRSDFKHVSAPIRKERLSGTSKARKEASRNKFLKKGRCQTESKALEKSMVAKNRLRTKVEFVKPTRNGVRMKQNLIENRPAWQGEKMG